MSTATQTATTPKGANAPSNRKPKADSIGPGSDRLLPETEAEKIEREAAEAAESNRQTEAASRKADADAKAREAKAEAEANEAIRAMLAAEATKAEAEYRAKVASLPALAMTRGQVEALVLVRKIEALIDEAGKLGNEAKIGAFQLLGKSANKAGKPQVAQAVLVMAVAAGSPDAAFSTRMQWAQTANKATVANAKGPFVVKSLGGSTDGQASYKLQMPEAMSCDVVPK